jgi:hypothetical protein
MPQEHDQRRRARAVAWDALCWVGVIVVGIGTAVVVFIAGALLGLIR